MSRNANEVVMTGGGNKMTADLLAPGAYAARVVQVVFLGVQKQRPWQGEAKPPVDEVSITYELADQFMKGEDGEPLTDKPRWLHDKFPFYSLKADRAKSTARYNAIDPSGKHGGDFAKLIGMPCQVVVVHNAGKGSHAGKTFENIGSVTPAVSLAGYEQPPLQNDTVYFDPQDKDIEGIVDVFNGLSEYIQGIIKGAEDYQGSAIYNALGGTTLTSGVNVPEGETLASVIGEDDCPF